MSIDPLSAFLSSDMTENPVKVMHREIEKHCMKTERWHQTCFQRPFPYQTNKRARSRLPYSTYPTRKYLPHAGEKLN